MSRYLGPERLCKEGQPLRNWCGFVITHVIEPWRRSLDGGECCGRSIVNVKKGPVSRPFADDRYAPFLYVLKERAALAERRARSVEGAITQHESLERPLLKHCMLHMQNCLESLTHLWLRRCCRGSSSTLIHAPVRA